MQLKGKLNGIALRVPTPNVSVVDLVINTEKKGMTAEDVNEAFRKAAAGPLRVCRDDTAASAASAAAAAAAVVAAVSEACTGCSCFCIPCNHSGAM